MDAYYPNAGLDIRPIKEFPDIRNWYYANGKEKSSFISELVKILLEIEFECILSTNQLLIFRNEKTNQNITYYMNSYYPSSMFSRYLPCSILVACGLKEIPSYYKWEYIICDTHQSFEYINIKYVTLLNTN